MNNKFALSVATALILSATPALAAEKAAGGVINFSGAITDTTCTINGGKSADFTVALNPITVEDAGTTQGIITTPSPDNEINVSKYIFNESYIL